MAETGAHVLVNGLSARLGGGGSVIAAHVRALLLAGGSAMRITVLVADATLVTIDDRRVRVVPVRRVPVLVRVLLEQLLVPVAARAWKADAVYCVGNSGLLLRGRTRRTVVLLQTAHHFPTLRPRHRATLYSRRRIARYDVEARLSRRTCARAAAVCCVSETLADAARSSWPEVADRVVAVPSTSPPLPEGGSGGTDGQAYCLFVANDYPHKEWCRVVQVFRDDERLPPLLLIGESPRERPCGVQPSDDLAPALADGRVVWGGAVRDRARLAALYREAAVVIVHSLTESGGLTLREAIDTNPRIVASDLPAHREVVEATSAEVALYPPDALDLLAEGIVRALASPERRPPDAGTGRTEIDLGRDLVAVLAPERATAEVLG